MRDFRSSKTLVSICIPTYNGEKYLQQAFDSVKRQTYENIEVIISDDNSADRTLELCEAFKKEADFPVYIYKHQPSVIGANWNHCIEKANGKYIKFLFQDDTMEPSCVETMVEVLEENKKIQLVAAKRKIISNFSEAKQQNQQEWISTFGDLQKQFENKALQDKNYYTINKNIFKREDFFDAPFNKIGEPSAVMLRKEIFKEIGPFRSDLKQILDYEYWYRILRKHPVAIINKQLVSFRIHDNQETNLNRSRKINDYSLYEEFQYKKLLSLVNRERQKYLLKKYNKIYKFLLSIYYKIR